MYCNWTIVSYSPTIPMDKLLHSAMLGYLGIPTWACAMASIKISVCLMLLRVEQRTSWRIFLYTMIGVQVCFAIVNVLFPMLQCRPVQALWDLRIPRTACLGDYSTQVASITASAINIATDLLLSLVPLTFIVQLRRPLAEKILLFLLMALGLFASTASIAKSVAIRSWGATDDFNALAIKVAVWTAIEEFLAIIAACAPWLKPYLQTLLERAGVRFTLRDTLSTALRGRISDTPVAETPLSGSDVERGDEKTPIEGNSVTVRSKSVATIV